MPSCQGTAWRYYIIDRRGAEGGRGERQRLAYKQPNKKGRQTGRLAKRQGSRLEIR